MDNLDSPVSLAGGKILLEFKPSVSILRLNRPTKLNALDWEMIEALDRLFDAWEQSDSPAVVVLASTSPKSFCAGADMGVLAEMTPERMQAWELAGSRMLDRIQFSPVVSIAAVSGYCFGGGCTLALACDFRLAASTAAFAQPEIDLGWIPGWGGVARLCDTIGISEAKRLAMTGVRLTADEAAALGLVNRVSAPEQLESEACALAADIASRNRLAVRTIKELASGATQPASTARRLDALANATLLMHDASQAAIRKFREKNQHA